MAYRNRYDRDGSASKQGFKAESDFVKMAQSLGFEIEKADKQTDMFNHVDYILYDFPEIGSISKFDIKARKSMRRGQEKQDDWLLLEKKNVNGQDGWLHGHADYIAFEQSNRWLICPRLELVRLWDEIVDETITVNYAADALGTIYTRRGRKDIISHIKLKDVENIEGIVYWIGSRKPPPLVGGGLMLRLNYSYRFCR